MLGEVLMALVCAASAVDGNDAERAKSENQLAMERARKEKEVAIEKEKTKQQIINGIFSLLTSDSSSNK